MGAGQRVKVIATLGPSSGHEEVVRALAAAGTDGFRCNTAHLQPGDLASLVALVRAAEAAEGRPLAVLCDLAGPKLRVEKGLLAFAVATGAVVTLGPPGSGAAIPVQGFDPATELGPGARVLLHDGAVQLVVERSEGPLLAARAAVGGEVAGGMGVNLPDAETTLPSLTARDEAFLAAGVAAGIDVFALSFVRRAEDVAALRRRLAAAGSPAPVIAKLEKAQAVEGAALDAILAVADMVMVARGDLGAETSPERVPVLQKAILRRARAAGVPAITATEMLESMIRSPRPTRAEASDVANAVFDGSDALLLTAETAIGAHPVEAVRACGRIVAMAEAHPAYRTAWFAAAREADGASPDLVADAVARGAVVAAAEVGAAAIVCFTTTGRTARLVARHRPDRPVLALAADEAVARTLALVWGVEPRVSRDVPADHEDVVRLAERHAVAHGLAGPGELVAVTHGAPLGARGATNLVRLHRIGEAG